MSARKRKASPALAESPAARPAAQPEYPLADSPSAEACANAQCRFQATRNCGRCGRGAFCDQACRRASQHVCVRDEGSAPIEDFCKIFKMKVRENKPLMRHLLLGVGCQGVWDLACGGSLIVLATRGAALALLPSGSRFGPIVPPCTVAPELACAVHSLLATGTSRAHDTPSGFKVYGVTMSGDSGMSFTLDVALLKSGRVRATLCLAA